MISLWRSIFRLVCRLKISVTSDAYGGLRLSIWQTVGRSQLLKGYARLLKTDRFYLSFALFNELQFALAA
ncbi:hypothetical protein BV372_34135 [Nostoc sp. T09]|nr:hypothetical protein BV372_34135 [Nostoc sp. T09]